MKASLWNKGCGTLLIIVIAAALKAVCGVSSVCIVGLHYGKIAVGCSNRTLRDLPGDLPRQTQKLFLSHNYISRITNDFWLGNCSQENNSERCSKFPHMLELQMSDNQLEEISAHSFFGMKQLRIISLKNNLLKTVHRDTFLYNSLLNFIDLSGNNISFIDPQLFQNLKYLHFLNLGNNAIHNLQCDVFKGLVNLTTLLINSNLITHLGSQTFADLGQLEVLRLDQNHINYLSRQLLGNLASLQTLNVSVNNLSYLDPFLFFNMRKLKNLDVSHNYVSKISKYLFQVLIEMKMVNFSFNNLTSLYLSHIPISLTETPGFNVVVRDFNACKDDFVNDIPCFIADIKFPWFGKIGIYQVDFSFNNITQILFSEKTVTHSLGLLKLSLAGNHGLQLPISLLKKERYIVMLNLDKMNLNWKNVTLFNEILQFPQLKSLSLIGCAACESYMQEVLFLIFNPKGRVSIICENEYTNSLDGFSDSKKSTGLITHIDRKSKDAMLSNNFTGKCSEKIDIPENFSSSCEHPCECIYKNTVLSEVFLGNRLSLECEHTMDCSYSSLSVPPELKQSLACVLMSNNIIVSVEENHFLYSSDMIMLDLSFNKLHDLPCKIFLALTNLKFLKLNNNRLVYLNASWFKNLTSLIGLMLHNNNIMFYDAGSFAHLKILRYLSINFSNLTRFHNETLHSQFNLQLLVMHETQNFNSSPSVFQHFRNLHNLRSCTIIGFNINLAFTHTFPQTNTLSKLQFERSRLLTLPSDSFSSIKNLHVLLLRENKIENIEKHAFRNLNNLTFLDFSHNLIVSMHSELFVDTFNLNLLNASYNKILCIASKTFKTLNKLKYLDLSSNNIVDIDWNIFTNMPLIFRVNLENNDIGKTNGSYLEVAHYINTYNKKIQNFSFCFENYIKTLDHLVTTHNESITSVDSKLAFMYFSYNHVTLLVKIMFYNFPLLKVLYIDHNSISQIDNEVFMSTVHLTHLGLNYNSIASINKNLFRNLTQLRTLLLDNNQLEFIEDGAFLDLHALQYLSLYSNRLKFFDAMLPYNNSLRVLDVSNNYIAHFNTKTYLPYLTNLLISNNPLGKVSFEFPEPMYSFMELQLENTGITDLEKDLFQNFPLLRLLGIGENCIGSLPYQLFTNMSNLYFLNFTSPMWVSCGVDSQLDWRNITLINHWFEMSQLDYLILAGHPICEGVQRTQIIEKVFLSEVWKNVICKYNFKLPTWSVSKDGNHNFVNGVPKVIINQDL